MKKETLKHLSKEKTVLKTMRIPESVLEKMQSKANVYCDGNLSEWIRYSSTKHTPRKKDRIVLSENSEQ